MVANSAPHSLLPRFFTTLRSRLSTHSKSTKQHQKKDSGVITAPPTPPSMAPIIHCVRHAQGYHNLSTANHSIHDPLLTPLGEEQCRLLQIDFPYHDKIDLIVASPIKRTIYTALLSFEDTIKRKNLKVVGLPELQETSDLPCDTPSSPEEVAREFEGKPVDLSLVTPGYESKRGKWAPTAKAIEARAREARQWLLQRPEKEIVVVTHGMHPPTCTPFPSRQPKC